MLKPVEIRHFHLFAGLGGGARGFNSGEARCARWVGRRIAMVDSLKIARAA